MYLTVGSIIIDDIILPDGQSRMGMLGGGSVHAAMGMRAWTDQVAICAPVGEDFPAEVGAQLEACFDTTGVTRSHLPTPRAWQLFEPDGHRTELFRTPFSDFQAINPPVAAIPAEVFKARAVHLQAEAPQPLLDWIARLRQDGCGFILWEPWESFFQAKNAATIRQILPLVDCFSPNLEEAQQVTGLADPLAMATWMLDAGAPLAAVRMGDQGSLIARADGRAWRVGVLPVPRLVDVTGAGNAYCGGFVVGMGESGDLLDAIRHAAVSASLALEQFGAIIPLDGLRERAENRLGQVEISQVRAGLPPSGT